MALKSDSERCVIGDPERVTYLEYGVNGRMRSMCVCVNKQKKKKKNTHKRSQKLNNNFVRNYFN